MAETPSRRSHASDRATRYRILFVVTEDWYFISHRLPMARAARENGFDVHVATRIDRHASAIEAEGFTLHPLTWQRRSLSPLSALASMRALRKLYSELRPDIVHQIALKPTLFGSLASLRLHGIATVNSVAGLGYVFTSDDWLARILRVPFRWAFGVLLNRGMTQTIVQNPDDRDMLEACGVRPEHIQMIRGSGVDVDVLHPAPEPDGEIRVTFVGRMLEAKGVRALVAAHELLAKRGVRIILSLAGTPDPANKQSLTAEELEAWSQRPGIEYLGHVSNIGAIWARSHIAALPSHREGLPKSLLEAASCGRPIVATDVPGCREVAVDDLNALLVPVDDAHALAAALERLARDAELRKRLGAAGRRLVEEQFSAARIGEETVKVYNELLNSARA